MQENKKKSKKIGMNWTLILFAMLPMIVVSIVISVILTSTSTSELKKSTLNSMLSIIKQTGTAFDYATEESKREIQGFIEGTVVREYMKNPSDAALGKKAQDYTVNYFNRLDGWEGIYMADWNSKVLTHPAPPVVGRVMREGDRLEELRNAMLNSDGIYNVGIITSPASGELIMSMYAPVYDEANKPIGYVGAGTFVNNTATHFSDVSSLGLSSAYIYFVDPQGTMLYHPDPEKIGNPVENAAVKGLVARIEAGEHPEPDYVEYDYKGKKKYAAFYVEETNKYIAVITADKDDVMKNINGIVGLTVAIAVISVIVVAVVAIIIARNVAKPLTDIARATKTLSTGDVKVVCRARSAIAETDSIIQAFGDLKNALNSSMSNVKDSADVLKSTIDSVDEQTSHNLDSITQISNAIDEVALTSQAVAENAQDMANKAFELDTNIENLGHNVSQLHEDSLSIRTINKEATDCMNSVYASANESVEAVASITAKINETNEAIAHIGNALQAIESIAAQTNLLSLNASIEAARAGEAGRGFAVVADEIRSLADSSAASAKEIKQIIGNVVELSSSTVEISNRVYKVISKEQADIQTTQEKFNILSDSVESSITEIASINEMTDQLAEIKKEMTNAITELGAISEELGASAEEVASSCQTVMNACADTQASTGEMKSVNDNMSEAISFFKV